MWDLIGGAEKHRTADLIYHDIGRYRLQATLFISRVLHILPLLDDRYVGHTLHKQQAGQGQPHPNGPHQIKGYCEDESEDQNRDVTFG